MIRRPAAAALAFITLAPSLGRTQDSIVAIRAGHWLDLQPVS